MSDDEKVRVKHVLNTIKGVQQWLGHAHQALSSLDPETELDVGAVPALGNEGSLRNKNCPPPEEDG